MNNRFVSIVIGLLTFCSPINADPYEQVALLYEQALAEGKIRRVSNVPDSDIHRYNKATQVRHVCNAACYRYEEVVPVKTAGGAAPSLEAGSKPQPQRNPALTALRANASATTELRNALRSQDARSGGGSQANPSADVFGTSAAQRRTKALSDQLFGATGIAESPLVDQLFGDSPTGGSVGASATRPEGSAKLDDFDRLIVDLKAQGILNELGHGKWSEWKRHEADEYLYYRTRILMTDPIADLFQWVIEYHNRGQNDAFVTTVFPGSTQGGELRLRGQQLSSTGGGREQSSTRHDNFRFEIRVRRP